MTIELLQECRSNEGWQPVHVKSARTPDTTYYLVLTASWLAPNEYICECEGYKFRGHCRHQEEADREVCQWTELAGPEQQSLAEQHRLECPRCGGPTRRVMEDV